MDHSDCSVGVDYISIFHPHNPPVVLGMPIACVTTDPVVAIEVGMNTS